jgi:HD-GYP domain-containing protein (c-di-GMP phosphodiesterase class II)
VVDVWDALRSERPYKKAWSEEAAGQQIHAMSGTHFDPKVVKAFLRVIATYSARENPLRLAA